MNAEFFTKNRKKVFDVIADNSLALFHSGYEHFKTADAVYPFVVNHNFFYLTGIRQANVVVLIVKFNHQYDEWLFIDENDPILAKWVGHKLSKEEASQISGIPVQKIRYNVDFTNLMLNYMQPLRFSEHVIEKLYLDLEYRNLPLYNTFALDFAKKVKEDYPALEIKNIYLDMIKLRMIKEPEEVELIRKSIVTTKEAIYNVMKNRHNLQTECDAEGYFGFVLTKNGKKNSFGNIIASGKNATVLHYEENNSPIEKDSLLLMDVGCYTENYSSDITRTFPVSGKFTKRQKEVYEVVLEVNKKCIAFAKAGVTWQEINDYAKELLAEGCIRLGLIKEKAELSRYYYHSIGHSLGLDVHDPSLMSLGLKEGMVITIEPGLYIAEEGIGVRIEDNILILEKESRNLSEDIIKEVDDIEKFLAE